MSYLTHLRNPSSHCYLLVQSEHSEVSERHLWWVSSCRGICSRLYWHRTMRYSYVRSLTLGWIPGGTSTLDCDTYSSDLAAFCLAAHFHHLELFSIQSHRQPDYHPLHSVQLIWSYHCRPCKQQTMQRIARLIHAPESEECFPPQLI